MTTQITIRGYLVGSIWWPAGAECWKTLNYNVTREDQRFLEPGTLRDHVLAATNDGDFQGCSIAQGELIVEQHKRQGATIVRRVRSWPLDKFPSVRDCLHDDPDWFPDYGDEDE